MTHPPDRSRRAVLTLAALWLLLCGQRPTMTPQERKVVAYLKAYAANRIDARLPRQTFESWLTAILGPTHDVTWDVDDCGEGGDGQMSPITCVTVEARLIPAGHVAVSMVVGDGKLKLSGVPKLWFAQVDSLGPPAIVKKLADLPAAIRTAIKR